MVSSEKLWDEETLECARACFISASQLLYCEPSPESVAQQIASGQFDEAPFAMDEEVARQGLALMSSWCGRVSERVGRKGDVLASSESFIEEVAALQREWLRLFVGVGVPEASCFESFYVDPNSAIFGRNVLEVRKSYRRYGLQLARLHSEPDDHLGLMLGFIGHMIGLELDARRSGDAGLSRNIASDQDAFLSTHMLPWLAVWRYNVGKFAASDYYRGLGEFVFGLCSRYALRFGVHFDAERSAFRRARP
ncbi:TorD/DmsD family molecular chaperone [Adlercreutzia aquisgranensis]|uniref:TorD/DmsD family molecular chaperone n=1 Tax=Adlercreutzia aquisgranensis TaxID=2941323 RepID=UPI00203D5E61|nr:molecular chaperone TorD family protein [Adlercreutzia aquisgranensis]